MIDSGYRRQGTNVHKVNGPMIIAIRLCTHCALCQTTPKYVAVSAVNSIDYAYLHDYYY